MISHHCFTSSTLSRFSPSLAMATKSTSYLWSAPISTYLLPREDTLLYCLALISILSLLTQHLSLCSALSPHFEGFEAEDEPDSTDSDQITDLPFISTLPPPTLTQSDLETDHSVQSPPSDPTPKPFDYWDEDEFEGLPINTPTSPKSPDPTSSQPSDPNPTSKTPPIRSYTVEIVFLAFLISFILNYFVGKRENEKIALAWAAQFAKKNSIFEKNFSILGTGDGNITPLLLKEGQDVFKFYASGRRFCQGLLGTMQLKSRHDLVSRIYNLIVPCKDMITFEVYMNEDGMDQVVFALARKKTAKAMHKEARDLQKYANLVMAPTGRKWVAEDLSVLSELREVAGDLVSEVVNDQVFGDKAFEKYGKGFISLHFSDQHSASHRKILMFKFALPGANNMADITRLVALVPYYIDLIGRYKLSPQARSKIEAARLKAAQETHKELHIARQEALQKRKAERRKMMEEAEAKFSVEAIRRKEEKEHAWQMKKSMPKVKMTRAR